MQATDFKTVKLTGAQKKVISPMMQSWRSVYPEIKDLEDSNASINMLMRMLVSEMANKEGPRLQLMTRLHMRINAMRQRMEIAQVNSAAKR
jgi:16S rRNA U1498 N3-methylase RsmE